MNKLPVACEDAIRRVLAKFEPSPEKLAARKARRERYKV